MTPMVPLAYAGLFWGASSLSIHVKSQQPGWMTQEECHTATEEDDCYSHVHWAMTRGITQHAKQFPDTLTASSSFEDFQAYLCTLDSLKGVCAIPCASAKPEDSMEAHNRLSAKLEASMEAHNPGEVCHTAVEGDECWHHVEWAMREGFVQHPDWYPTLNGHSSFEDFQEVLYSFANATHACGRPCDAQQKKQQLTGEMCRTSVKGEVCFNQVTWAMQTGWVEHPAWYPKLTDKSTFADFQTHIHGLNSHLCALPCPAKAEPAQEEAPKKEDEPPAQGEVADGKDQPPAEETAAKAEPAQEEAPKQEDEAPAQGEVAGGKDQLPAEETVAKAEPAQEEAPKQEDEPPAQGEVADGKDQPPAEETAAKAEPAQDEAAKQEDEPPAQGEVTDGGDQLPAVEEVRTEDDKNCHTAVEGDLCYKIVTWSMNRGINWHPKWYVGLTRSSTFEEFQAFLHGKKRKCPRPCAGEATANVAAQPVAEEPSAAKDAGAAANETTVAAQPAAEEPSAAEDRTTKQEEKVQKEECHTAVKGEACHKEVAWAMTLGLEQHPDWYWPLTKHSSFKEFQTHLYSSPRTAGVCTTKPCDVDQSPAKEATQRKDQVSAKDEVQTEACHTAVKGEPCYRKVNWAMGRGMKWYPSKFPGLTNSSSFEAVQAWLYSKKMGKCPQPCAAASGENVAAEVSKRPQAGAAEVDEAASEPEEQGCYMSQPAGCTNHPEVASRHGEWVKDKSGRSVDGDEVLCLGRGPANNEWCGVENTKMLWIPPPAPEVPSEPGCYVWKPSGCPRQNQPADGSGWKVDITKTHEAAATTLEACLARKTPFDHYCGTTSIKMIYVHMSSSMS